MKKNNWVYKVFLCTFILSVVFSFITNFLSSHSNIFIMIIIITIVIAIGIIFDMIGASSLTSKEATFHSMSSKKIKGAKETIKLIKNNAKVSSVCNDIVGDICGIISGGLGAVLAISIAKATGFNTTLISVIIAAIISSLTVGGKAIFKSIAIKNSDKIIFNVGKFVSIFKK
ncbi:MAG: hypothetical protein PUD07_01025 [bacterium]|nr:hypothetical protein [bacterium]